MSTIEHVLRYLGESVTIATTPEEFPAAVASAKQAIDLLHPQPDPCGACGRDLNYREWVSNNGNECRAWICPAGAVGDDHDIHWRSGVGLTTTREEWVDPWDLPDGPSLPVSCQRCGAVPGRGCRAPSGWPAPTPHRVRRDLYAEEIGGLTDG